MDLNMNIIKTIILLSNYFDNTINSKFYLDDTLNNQIYTLVEQLKKMHNLKSECKSLYDTVIDIIYECITITNIKFPKYNLPYVILICDPQTEQNKNNVTRIKNMQTMNEWKEYVVLNYEELGYRLNMLIKSKSLLESLPVIKIQEFPKIIFIKDDQYISMSENMITYDTIKIFVNSNIN